MSTAAWIAVVIGIAQSVFLAVAAIFAWRAYDLAKTERHEALKENRLTEDRRLFEAIVDEVKLLARQVEEVVPGVGNVRLDLIAGHQRALKIALGLFPHMGRDLHQTELILRQAPGNTGDLRNAIDGATNELARLAPELAPGSMTGNDESSNRARRPLCRILRH